MWPNCCAKKKLQVHHIMPWSKYPDLRYNSDNGITLCKYHHKVVTGKEIYFAKMFMEILNVHRNSR
jgi:hypothetical protein